MKYWLLIVICALSCSEGPKSKASETRTDFSTVFEKSEGLETATYDEVITYYRELAAAYPEIKIREMGTTDAGKPLHLVTFNKNSLFDYSELGKTEQVLLINNGIHPGESDGIDATMMLFRDLANGTIERPKHTTIATIPIYNIGGSLNRNSTSRTNQNGPKAYGFRGNARNFDLNRDFIKSDTKNARSFAELFHLVKPDVFIDNHVSNGADYQYTLTHLFTQHNKLGGALGNFLNDKMMPTLESKLKDRTWDITPYVNVFNSVPEEGFSQFMDYPRYSTGYTTLWNTLGMMVETHMLKPYKQRVEGTYELMKAMIEITEEEGPQISELRQKAFQYWNEQDSYPLNWKIDTTKSATLQFKGFEGAMIESELTGAKRLKYDGSKPFVKSVKYQNVFTPSIEVTIPDAYLIPQGWHEVIDLLKLNKVEFTELKNDSLITVDAYRIESFETRKSPYEGHYQHYNVQLSTVKTKQQFGKGDLIVNTHQNALRYLIETLEPQAPDSFFNWNFFDTVLQQKEGFSPYVWEDLALELLTNNDELKLKFEAKKEEEPEFAKNWYTQLDWLHKQSAHYEMAHMQYPIYRIIN